jgi:hypothetical protein
MQLILQSQMRALQLGSVSKPLPAASWRISPVVSVQPSRCQQQQQVPRHTRRLPALPALDTDKYGGNEKVLDVSQLLQQVSTLMQDCADATATVLVDFFPSQQTPSSKCRFNAPSPAINAAAVFPGTAPSNRKASMYWSATLCLLLCSVMTWMKIS